MNELALQLGFDTHTWQLAWAMADFLGRNGHWSETQVVHHNALGAADRVANKHASAYAHRALGLANARLGMRDDARSHYECALQLFGELDDHVELGQTHLGLGTVFDMGGNQTEALRHAHQAHDHFRAAGIRSGQANALNNIGWFHAKLGEYEQALSWCQQALAALQELGDTLGAAYALDSLGYIHRRLGDQHKAITCYRRARDMFRGIGDFQSEAETLAALGDLHDDKGDADAARAAWRQALDIFSQMGHPLAEQVRAKLTTRPAALRC